MFGISFTHLIILAVIVLIVVGPEQLPDMARNIARMLNEWRRATSDIQSSLVNDFRDKMPRQDAPFQPGPEVEPEPQPDANLHHEHSQLELSLDEVGTADAPVKVDDDGDKKS